jgi:hypothetical protein
MEAVVSDAGLILPKRMLRGMQRVSIQKRDGVITITPQPATSNPASDPLLSLGSDPSKQALRTGSAQHDQLIYNGR